MTRYHFSPKTKKAEPCTAQHKCDYGDTEHIDNPTQADLEEFTQKGLEEAGETASTVPSASRKPSGDKEKQPTFAEKEAAIVNLQGKLRSQQNMVVNTQKELESGRYEEGSAQHKALTDMLDKEKEELRRVNDEIADVYNGKLPEEEVKRQKEGSGDMPAEFAEPSVASAPRGKSKWGKTPDLKQGSQTPWGKAQDAEQVASGITAVSTASHGGLKLSAKRNRAIPEELREEKGWYEEDSAASIVGMHHPDAFPKAVEKKGEDAVREEAEKQVKNWYPDQYESATGKTVSPEESYERKRQQEKDRAQKVRDENPDKFVAEGKTPIGFGGEYAEYSWVPEGQKVISASVPETGEKRHFLVPEEEAIGEDKKWRKDLVVDPEKHADVSDVVDTAESTMHPDDSTVKPRLRKGDDVSFGGKTDAMGTEQSLSRKWRWQENDGSETIESKEERLRRNGVQGKNTAWKGNKQTYWANLPDSRLVELDKGEYESLETEDTTDKSTATQVEYLKAEDAYRRAEQNSDKNSSQWSDARLEKARKKLQDAKSAAKKQSEKASKSFVDRRAEATKAAENAWLNNPASDKFTRNREDD